MKKLTAGIFATLLTVVTVGAANAEIASKTYVDAQVDTRATTESVTTLTGRVGTVESSVTSQGTRLTTAEGEIDTLQANSATKTELTQGLAGKQDSALIKSAQYSENKGNDTSYPSVKAVADAITAVSGGVTGVTEDVAELQGKVTALESNPAVTSGITSEKVTQYDGYDAKITAAQGAADAAQDAADAAQAAADTKLEKATYNAQVGTVSAETMGTTASTVVTAINEVNTKAGTAATDAAQAKSDAAQAKTDAAQAKTDATQAKSDAAAATTAATNATETATQAKSTADTASQTATQAKSTAEEAKNTAEEAKTTALAAIPKPTDPSCDNPTNKCVLTYNNSAYEWEVVAR